MNSSRPYLIRALYEWIVENDCTPHLLVDADYPGARVPPGYAKDGQVVLNVSPSAVRHLHMDNDAVSFEGRFGGVPQSLFIPAAAVLAVYARENGQGMAFPAPAPAVLQSSDPTSVGAPALSSVTPSPADEPAPDAQRVVQLVPLDAEVQPPPEPPKPAPAGGGPRPALKRIK